MTAPDNEKVLQYVSLMHSKKPAGSRLTADVCISVLQKKLAQFPKLDWIALHPLITLHLATLDAPVVSVPQPTGNKEASEESDDEDDDDSDDDSSDDEESSDGSDGDSDGSDEEDSSLDDSEESGQLSTDSEEEADKVAIATTSTSANDDGNRAERKRRKKEAPTSAPEEEETDGQEEAAPKLEDLLQNPSKYITDALKFLRQCGLKLRSKLETETDDEYVHLTLLPFFAQKELDPTELSKDDSKRYKIRLELEELKKEVDMTLDKTQRKGRANFTTMVASAPKPMFMDD